MTTAACKRKLWSACTSALSRRNGWSYQQGTPARRVFVSFASRNHRAMRTTCTKNSQMTILPELTQTQQTVRPGWNKQIIRECPNSRS